MKNRNNGQERGDCLDSVIRAKWTKTDIVDYFSI